MNLGERIYTLRTERNLSQGDLADALDVSQQSISKWENNNSVPDLDKLVKLSALFGVSLDELVLGEKKEQPEPTEPPAAEPKPRPNPKETGFPPRKIVGAILLCMGCMIFLVLGILGGLLSGLLYSFPLLLGGAACFVFRRDTGIWCGWVIAFALDLFVRYTMSINWRYIFLTFSAMTPIRVMVGWGQFLCLLLLAIITARRFGAKPLEPTGKIIASLLCGWIIWVILQLLPFRHGLYARWHVGIDWCLIAAAQVLLVFTVRLIRARRKQKANS